MGGPSPLFVVFELFVVFMSMKGVAHAPTGRIGFVLAVFYYGAGSLCPGVHQGVARGYVGCGVAGVTVEASSPALIEKTRSVVTSGTGQDAIVDLRPGTCTVTFTFPGSNTVKREGIELTGNFVASVSVDMRVGAVGNPRCER